jgi:hypothetical protein
VNFNPGKIMFLNTQSIMGRKLSAIDGDIGQVGDFYFDDKTWAVRYVVAETGTWLTGRSVLLSPYAFFNFFDTAGKAPSVNLTRRQIENSPSIELHRPVSRQFEENYHRYYGWPAYWQGGQMWGKTDFPVVTPASPLDRAILHEYARWDDIHLRSTRAVTGYQIEALDGTIGTVSGFTIDDRTWAVRDLVVETGHWYAGKEILISRHKVDRISYAESKVHVILTKSDIQNTRNNEVAQAVA